MKKTNTRINLIFILLITSFYSCNSPKMGFFNSSSPTYTFHNQSSPISNETLPSQQPIGQSATHPRTLAEKQAFAASPIAKKTTAKTQVMKSAEMLSFTAPQQKLNKAEKKEIKKYITDLNTNQSNKETTLSKGILVLLAIILPPLAVALVDGISGPFWLSILLTLLFYVPGLVYALYRIFKSN